MRRCTPSFASPRVIGAALVVLALLAPLAARAEPLEHNPMLLDSPREPVQALDFTAQSLSGKQVRLSDFRGQVVLLNFWATWCVPCILEMPAMDRLNRKMAGRPFKLLAVNQSEERERVARFAREHRFSFEVLLDPIGEIGSNYGANRLPMSYVIDAKGFVIRRAVGPREWDSDVAVQFFERLMGEAQSPNATAVTEPATR